MTETRRSIPEKVLRELARGRRRYASRRFATIVARRVYGAAELATRLALAKKRFRASALFPEPDTLFLARIVGNDLEPRHKKGQSLENVRFILENEPAFATCTKYWLLNRIVDPAAQQGIVDLLERHRQEFCVIPFEASAYRSVDWDLRALPRGDYRFTRQFEKLDERAWLRFEAAIRRKKNLYLMNNNGARNLALSIGRKRAKWVLPWDGNCFLTQSAFEEIRSGLQENGHVPYHLVPMARTGDNALLLSQQTTPGAREEPQIIFRRDAAESFDEEIPYGRRPKVDLLWRLGVPGEWDRYELDPWDPPYPPLAQDRWCFKQVGWVARLASGRADLELGRRSSAVRGAERDAAIVTAIDRVDSSILERELRPRDLTIYEDESIEALGEVPQDPINKEIRGQADLALGRGPYSVVDKSTVAPSGDPHDYFHPAPYWWPDPSSRNGLPYIQRDGVRSPETELYHPQSGKFDRTRLQLLFDDTLHLALAWRLTGEARYAEHGALLIRTWFLDERTRMTPHMLYAQFRAGHDARGRAAHGIIEFKDVFYFLDAVRLIERSGALASDEGEGLRAWFGTYASWLDTDPEAVREFRSHNNHGVFFDLQRAGIAAFLGDGGALNRIRLHSRERLHGQVAADGSLPAELARTRPRHYVLFTLQGWANLARLMSTIGEDLWRYRTADGRGLELALDWLKKAETSSVWPTVDEVDPERFVPLMLDRARHYSAEPSPDIPSVQVFHPAAAIPPYRRLWRH